MGNFLGNFFKGENPINWAIAIASLAVALVAWWHHPTETISIHYALIFGLISFILITKLGFLAYSLSKINFELQTKNEQLLDATIPRIVSFHEQTNKEIFIATKSPLFPIGILVTIVYTFPDYEGYERPLCTGQVKHIQMDSPIMQIYINRNLQYENNKQLMHELLSTRGNINNFKVYPGEIREE